MQGAGEAIDRVADEVFGAASVLACSGQDRRQAGQEKDAAESGQCCRISLLKA